MAQKLYTYSAVNNAIDKLISMGYDINVIPGSLLDNYICLPPDNSYLVYEFREVFLNVQSSAYRVRRSSKVSQRMLKEIAIEGE